MIDWTAEYPQILEWSARRGVDPLFIAAIRHTENGGPGRELGCLNVGADTYDAQLRVATRTIAGLLLKWTGRPFDLVDVQGFKRLRYAENFVASVALAWAPIGVANDPHNLNANWLTNVLSAYETFLSEGDLS